MKDRKQELLIFLKNYISEIKSSAYELLDQKMPELNEDLFSLFEKNGNRLSYEKVYFARRKFLAILAIESILEKEENGYVQSHILEKLIYVIEEICKEACWALPAHVARIDRKTEDSWRIIVDLFASETAQTLSELWDRLSEDLPSEIRKMIVDEIERRVLQPFFTSKVPYDNWEHSDHNWNAVCNGCIGSVCIHLKDHVDELENKINRICKSLQYYINGFSDDGVCKEGLGYYVYGMNYFSNFAQELYDYTEGEMDLFSEDVAHGIKWKDKLIKIAKFPARCHFPDGLTVGFSDCIKLDMCRIGILSTLAMHYDSLDFLPLDRFGGVHSDQYYRFAGIKMDMLNTARYIENLDCGAESKEAVNGYYHAFPKAQWYIAGSKNGVGFACKGGHNGEQHNHNDVGHFIYEKDEVMLLTDLGAGEYNREYFGSGRYDVICNSSLGHSVPVINGMGQTAGEQYRCRTFETSGDGHIKMEIGGAYDDDICIIRNLQFDLENGQLFLSDTFEGVSSDTEILESLITQVRPELYHNTVILQRNNDKGVSVTGQIIVLDEDAHENIHVQEYVYINHQGEPELVYAIRWKVKLIEKNAVTRVRIEYKT